MNRSPKWPAILLVVAVCVVIFVLLLAAERGGSYPAAGRDGVPHSPARSVSRTREQACMVSTAPRSLVLADRDADHPRPEGLYGFMPCGSVRQAADLWRGKARGGRSAYDAGSRRLRKWRCVHSHEGAGTSEPGVLRRPADRLGLPVRLRPVISTPLGHADRWPVWAQLVAAERAYASRGWSPWPNTARACGLL